MQPSEKYLPSHVKKSVDTHVDKSDDQRKKSLAFVANFYHHLTKPRQIKNEHQKKISDTFKIYKNCEVDRNNLCHISDLVGSTKNTPSTIFIAQR
jgi:hypothetical protein